MKSLLRKTEVFIRRKIVQYGKKYYTYQDQKRLHNHQFVIISNNCFGGQVYQWLGKPIIPLRWFISKWTLLFKTSSEF